MDNLDDCGEYNYNYEEYFDEYDDYFLNYDYNFTHNFTESEMIKDRIKLFVTSVAPIIIITGCIGNVLAFIVLQTHLFFKTPCGFLLSALACTDTAVLLTHALHEYVAELGIDYRNHSNFACKFLSFSKYVFPMMSSNTLVLVTVDRVLSIALPLRSREICSLSRMCASWGIMAACVLCLGIWPMIEYELGCVFGELTCQPPKTFVFVNVFSWIDFVFGCLIPLTVIVVGNSFIVVKLFRAEERRRTTLSIRRRADSHSNSNMRSVTVMLVFLGVVFFLTTLPRSVIFLTIKSIGYEHVNEHAFARVVCLNIYFINNAVNFFLYCISGSRFRLAMKGFFCCTKTRYRSSSRASVTKAKNCEDRMSSEDCTLATSVV